ncbi:methyl-accepting chemotaxis protein [Peribacillus frigoritolerans]|uniref:methyl-accepting chemotaxis protein n=1 Tax=Peribacillus frigoritolerans TaxID=450367 RepID=UPI00227EAF7C|nr:HAMP domain-containing methyl-accepting chemotaxis protein [Peribacillus frigoritolerans]MCY8939131.1 methyl-accepting chemotaxis protein [Peribacillus frigoritolerans]
MNKLSTKIGFVLLTGMIITLIGSLLLMYKSTKDTVEKTIAMSSLDIASNISQGINPTSYADFLSNQSETSTYWEIREQLDDYRQKTGALYVYTLGIDENSEKVHILIDGMGKGNNKASPSLTPTTATSFQDVESVMKGKASTTSIVHDSEYGDYLSVFVPIKNGNEVIGILGVDIDASKVDATASKVLGGILPLMIIINVILMAIVVGALIWFLTKKLTPLLKVSLAAKEISNGDLLTANKLISNIRVKGNDEIKVLVKSFEEIITNTTRIVNSMKSSSFQLIESSSDIEYKIKEMDTSTQYIVNGIQQVAGAAEVQLHRSEESSRVIEEMTIGIQRIAEASSEVSEQTNHVSTRMSIGNKDINELSNQILQVKDVMLQTSSRIKNLDDQANEIVNIVHVITGIAEQTNLLSLNAAIEAARAGEQGKGFAVVSNEVRKLAVSTKESAIHIQESLLHFKSIINESVKMMETGTNEVEEGTKFVLNTRETFKQTIKSFEHVSDQIQEISAITEQMAASSQEINASIEDFAGLTRETAVASKQVAQSTDQQAKSMEDISFSTSSMVKLANDLETSVERFNA